jgi:hypothetical protein
MRNLLVALFGPLLRAGASLDFDDTDDPAPGDGQAAAQAHWDAYWSQR